MQRYNFEIHITVECKDEETFINFKSICNKIDAKAIAINLVCTSQTMTSKTVNSTEFELYDIIAEDKNILIENGFKILRIKVESVLNLSKTIQKLISITMKFMFRVFMTK